MRQTVGGNISITETTELPLKKFRRLAQDTAARATISSVAPLA